jgi:hypothetical protein
VLLYVALEDSGDLARLTLPQFFELLLEILRLQRRHGLAASRLLQAL